MPTKVMTVNTCDRCERVHVTEGPEGRLPDLWSWIKISQLFPATVPTTMILCPKCASGIRKFIGSVPKADPVTEDST